MIGYAFLIFIGAMIFCVPIGVAMGFGALAPNLLGATGAVKAADAVYILRTMVVGIDSTPILAIPLFMYSGVLMARGGISKRLFDVFAYFSGTKTAGLPCAVILTCLFYGAISGSGPATCAAVGAMTIPLLVSLGYDKSFCASIIATAGGLGLIIPPSISYINYALVTGTSVTSLFAAGVLPGILIALCLMAYTYYYCKKHGEDKQKIAANYELLRQRRFLGVLKDGIWALLCPVIILGSIYSGICTPTEAAAISVLYALIISMFVYKNIKPRDLLPLTFEAVKSFTPLCLLIAMATAFGRILTLANAPQSLAAFITEAISSRTAFLLLLNLVLLILGMFIDGAPAILILSPLLMPVAASYGIDPVHLGIIIVTNMTIGLASPPFGLNLFVSSSLTETPVMTIGKKVIPFVVAFIVSLLIITFVPWLSLALT